jgi:hypothetical protein
MSALDFIDDWQVAEMRILAACRFRLGDESRNSVTILKFVSALGVMDCASTLSP